MAVQYEYSQLSMLIRSTPYTGTHAKYHSGVPVSNRGESRGTRHGQTGSQPDKTRPGPDPVRCVWGPGAAELAGWLAGHEGLGGPALDGSVWSWYGSSGFAASIVTTCTHTHAVLASSASPFLVRNPLSPLAAGWPGPAPDLVADMPEPTTLA